MRAFVLFVACAFAFLTEATSEVEKRSSVLPNPNDVLTMTCDQVPCTTPPYVYNTKGGKVIPAPSLCIVFWGQVPDTTQTISDMIVDVFQNSNYTDGWSEYGVVKRPSLHPACGRGITLASDPGAPVATSDVATQIREQVAAKVLPPVTLNTHYVFFLGAALRPCTDSSDRTDFFCGYHDTDSGSDDLSFTVIPDFSPANTECNGMCVGSNVVFATQNQIDWFEATKAMLTQLVLNAASDPFGDAWLDPEVVDGTKGEVGDLCFDYSGVYQDVIADHVVQKWYSQQRKGCVTTHLDYVAEAVACGTYDPTSLAPIGWTHHPYDCTDQYDHSRCMYCKGWANGKIVKQCLPRLGAKCNPTFDTAPRQAFCNLEFECSGSLLGLNVVALVSVVLLFAVLFA